MQKGEAPLPVLEVGAVNRQLLSCHWLKVLAIDLQSRDDKIQQIDFFAIEPKRSFAVVVLSMVLNCVSDARQRGDMLRRCFDHLQPGGHLFLMLPLRCLHASPHMTDDHFVRALKFVGFDIRERKETPKIAFFCCQVPLSASVSASVSVSAGAGQNETDMENETETDLQSETKADRDRDGDGDGEGDRDEHTHASASASGSDCDGDKDTDAGNVPRAFAYPPRVINKGKGKTCDFAVCFE